MQDPDPKCRHFGILWHFGIFAKKSNKKSNPIFYQVESPCSCGHFKMRLTYVGPLVPEL